MKYNEIETALSLRSRAVIITPSIGVMGITKTDKAASARVAQSERAEKDAARVLKTIVDRNDLKMINRKRDEMRTYYRALTAPWGAGTYLLPTVLFQEFLTRWDELTGEFHALVDEYVTRRYPVALATAARRMGDLYNPLDYPTPEEVRSRFHVSIEYQQIPDASDWRIDAPDAVRDHIAQQITSNTAEVLQTAAGDLRERLLAAVERLARQLDGGKLFPSLTGDLDKACRVALAGNLADDQELTKLATAVNTRLNRYDVSSYREDENLRRLMADEARDLLREYGRVVDVLTTEDQQPAAPANGANLAAAALL